MNKYIAAILICLSSIGLTAFVPQIPGQNPFETPSFAPPSGQMPMPSPDDFAALNQYLEELQQNDPAQLQELERMGNELIASLSDQELEEFSSMFGVDPQELRKEAESYLTQNEPQEEPEIRPEQQAERERPTKKEPQKTETPQPAKTPAKDAQKAQDTTRALLKTIEELRAKGAASELIESHLRTWEDDLVLLIFYLKLLDKAEHARRLPAHESGKIITTLANLEEKISPLIKLIDPSVEKKIPNEYAFFDFNKAPTTQELQTAYQKKRAQYEPKTIEATLTKQGKSTQAIKQELKLARITQIAIDEEYERLSDPKNLAEIQRKEAQIKKEIEDTQKNWKLLLSKITKEFGDAFFEKKLLSKLEEYLQQYEPEELKIKKAQEKAIKEQEKEQAKRAKKAPETTKGSSVEPKISYGRIPKSYSGGRGSSRGYSSGGYSSPSSSSSYSDYNPSRPSSRSSSSSSGSSSYGDSGRSSTSNTAVSREPEKTLADTAQAQGQKLTQKMLKTSMTDFTKLFNEVKSLVDATRANITPTTTATEKTRLLKDFITKEPAIKLSNATALLAKEAERLAELGKKDKEVAKEFEKYFEKISLKSDALIDFLENPGVKDTPIVQEISKNIKKTEDVITSFKKKTK